MIEEINNYKILREIDSGGFSTVYKGRKENKFYALKMMKNTIADLKKTKEEIKSLKIMNKYEHCIKFYEAIYKDDFVYLVFEYIRGGNLNKYIKELKSFDFKQSKDFLLDILEQIEFISKHNRLHFDITPYNILNKNDKFLLIDWGVSENLEDLSLSLHKGYKVYCAPEVFNSIRTISSEIYSLACCLYYALTKKIIFDLGKEEETLEERMYKHTYFKPNLEDIKSEKLRYLLYRMLEKDYKKRASINEIKNILKDEFKTPLNYIYSYEEKAYNIDIQNTDLLLEKLAKDNILFAKDLLAQKYKRDKDNLNAFLLFKQGSKKGLLQSTSNLALLFYKGIGVQKDINRALDLFKQSINHKQSQYYIGQIIEKGLYKDDKSFLYWYKKSAFNGYSLAVKKIQDLKIDISEDIIKIL